MTPRLSLCVGMTLVVLLAACSGSGAGGSSSESPPVDTNSPERTTMTTVAGSTSTTSRGVTSTTPPADIDISGKWVLTDHMVNGEWHPIEAGDRYQPWLKLENGVLSGDPDACNEYGGEYSVNGHLLQLKNVWQNLAACGQEVEDIIEPFFSEEGPIEVDVDGSLMIWAMPSLALRFSLIR